MVSMKYQESYVYKIQSLVTDDYFIASTTQKVSQRIKTLRRNYREYKAGKRVFTAACKVMGAGDYTYEILEKAKCGSKMELRQIEQESGCTALRMETWC